jgi:hypothetical protein
VTLKKHKLLHSVPYRVHEFQKGMVLNAVGTSAKTSNVAFDTTEMVDGLRRDEHYCGALGIVDTYKACCRDILSEDWTGVNSGLF